MSSDMEMSMNQRDIAEFLCAEKMTPIDIHWHLLNVDGHQTMDVGTTRWYVVCFSSTDSDSESPSLCRFLLALHTG